MIYNLKKEETKYQTMKIRFRKEMCSYNKDTKS